MVLEILPTLQIVDDNLNTVLQRSGLHESPEQRISAARLLELPAFKSPFSYAFAFLSDYVLKPDSQKILFFEEFPYLAAKIPEELLSTSIIPQLLSPLILTDHLSKNVVSRLLTPGIEQGGLVSVDAFSCHVAPQIIRCFRSHELTTRLLLLKDFTSYARFLGKDSLVAIILPEVCLGVFDSSDLLASSSLSAISHLSYLLGVNLVLSHLISLGEAMRTRGLLDCYSKSPAGRYAEVFTQLSVGGARTKPLIYSAASRPWRRTSASLFPDAAPKVDRQRAATIQQKSKRLLDVAALSSTYVPPAAVIPKPAPPPVTKLSSSKVESKRSFSTIFATIDATKKSLDSENPESPDLIVDVNGRLEVNGAMQSEQSLLQTPSDTSPSLPPSDPPDTMAFGKVHREKEDDVWNEWDESDPVIASTHTPPIASKSPHNGSCIPIIPNPHIPDESNSLVQTLKKLTMQQAQVDKLLGELEPSINFSSQSSSMTSSTSNASQPKPTSTQPRTNATSLKDQIEPEEDSTSRPKDVVKLESTEAVALGDHKNLRYQLENDDESSAWGQDWGDDENL